MYIFSCLEMEFFFVNRKKTQDLEYLNKNTHNTNPEPLVYFILTLFYIFNSYKKFLSCP